ncbi:hypothetical protein [Gemmiger sp.]
MPEEKKFKTIDEKLASLTQEQAKYLFDHLNDCYLPHTPEERAEAEKRQREQEQE